MADWRAPAILLLVLSPAAATDKSFCFAMADSYYEQLYCEIKARGEGRSLPDFYQFQKNDTQTQALLLKRPAARLGIEVKTASLHKTTHRQPTQSKIPAKTPAKPPAAQRQPAQAASKAAAPAPDNPLCQLSQRSIRCDNQHFALLHNQNNRHLAKGALGPDNRLSLPAFSGDYDNEAQVRDYLYLAYARYLDRMQAIGLGGVTTSFDKFSYLFYDYHERGLSFTDRFETLYHYLKKDKASLPVSETPGDTQGLSLNHCAALSDRFYVCQWRNQNLVFAADTERKQP